MTNPLLHLTLTLLLLSPAATSQETDQSASAQPTIGRLPAAKVLFLGNSITLHGPAPHIGWTGNWGMAASAQSRDYVHLVTQHITAATGVAPRTMVRNIASFEREYQTFNIRTQLHAELEFNADIVILAIGENTQEPRTEAAKAEFATAFSELLTQLEQHGQPAIFVRSSFWPNTTKDNLMRQASDDAGVVFVDISALARDKANAAASERKLKHAGVAAHPGDRGMKNIADAIVAAIHDHADTERQRPLIGYTQLQTNLPGGRHANVRTMRASVVNADGTHQRTIAAELADDPNAWTQFGGWSPDGGTAVISRGWQSPENAELEEQRQSFHFSIDGWKLDSYLVDFATRETHNVTDIERVSFYNGGLFFWPGDPSKLGFTALIDGNSHPFRMDRDGHHKTDLTAGSQDFTYGFHSSRDGSRICYHKNYQIWLADADGTNAVQIQTGNPFNFGPTWSPDGQWVLFVSGEHYDCHPYIVRADGTALQQLADRGGYRGVTEFLDVPDFHGGSSDTPVWATDSKHVFYTAQVGSNVELFSVALDGVTEQLTSGTDGALHYHPQPSPNGSYLVYGSRRKGTRQLFVMDLADHTETRLTSLMPGHAAMWPHWQPVVSSQTATPDRGARLLSATPAAVRDIANLRQQGLMEIEPVHLPPESAGDCNHYGWPIATMTDDTMVVMHRRIPGHNAKGAGKPDPTMSYGIVLRSTDGGHTWSQPYDLRDCMQSEDRHRGGIVPLSHRAKFDRNNRSTAGYKVHLHSLGTDLKGGVVAINNHGVFRSDDAGRTWKHFSTALRDDNFPHEIINLGPRILDHPQHGLMAFGNWFGEADSYHKLSNRLVALSSADGGATWAVQEHDVGFPQYEPAALWHDGRYLFVTRDQTKVRAHKQLDWLPNRQPLVVDTNLEDPRLVDTVDFCFNPVTDRFEMVRSERHHMELWLWSMAPADWQTGRWRRECRLLACAGKFYATADGFHPAGAVIDIKRGVQHIFIYVGHPNGPAGVFRITRTLQTPRLVSALARPDANGDVSAVPAATQAVDQ